MSAYAFITEDNELLLITAGSMNEAEQTIAAEHPDITLQQLKDGRRLYTRKHGVPVRVKLEAVEEERPESE